MKKQFLFVVIFLSINITFAQKTIYHHQILGSMSYTQYTPLFVENDYRIGKWHNVNWNSQWFELGYQVGQIKQDSLETIKKNNASEWRIGLNFAPKKMQFGNRVKDIRGFLIVPNFSINYTNLTVKSNINNYNRTKIHGVRVAPGLSFQFPFFAIDMKGVFDYRQKKLDQIKKLGFHPEICFRIDGLYNLLDPTFSYQHKVNTYSIYDSVTGRQYTNKGVIIYKDIKKRPYSYDVYSNDIEPFWALAPRVTISRQYHRGNTLLIGGNIGIRKSVLGFDIYADAGQLGFASMAKKPMYKGTDRDKTFSFNQMNKESYEMAGSYKAVRMGVSGSIETFTLLSVFSKDGLASGSLATKFTRFYIGFGGGYAFISNPTYKYENGKALAESYLSSNPDLEANAHNSAIYGKSSPMVQVFTSLEVGVLQLKYEYTYYFPNAFLSNGSSFTIAYLLPLKRLAKGYQEIKK